VRDISRTGMDGILASLVELICASASQLEVCLKHLQMLFGVETPKKADCLLVACVF
jgi:hypothetical protein